MGRVVSVEVAAQAADEARAQGRPVILTNGAFDLLHVGHLRYLQGARALDAGALLVVGINDDGSVRRSKGSSRPVIPHAERAELVAAIEGVDLVVLFGDDTVESLVRRLRPTWHAKGTDYTEDTVPEREVVRAMGGTVVIVGDPKEHATSDVVQRLSPAGPGCYTGAMTRPGTPVVISAPSGAGKTTLCRRVMAQLPNVEFSISHTTRAPRGAEKSGVDYHFVNDDTFTSMVEQGAFLEWAHVHNRRYGTERSTAEARLAAGKDLLFDIDVQGGRQIATRLPGTVLVYVLPPNLHELEKRLRRRGSDSEEQVQQRLRAAREEIRTASTFYTHWILNDDLDRAVEMFAAILMAERLRRQDVQALLRQVLGEA